MWDQYSNHYLQQGSKPIAVVLNCSKAFDLARFDKLFSRLLDRIPAIVVRVLSFCYKEQLAWVRWGKNMISGTFSIQNGTRQGSVGSPTFWEVYLNPLLEDLRASGVGCHVGGVFTGVVAYADDILLLAPNRKSAQILLDLCEKFAMENNIKFSTHPEPRKSKSKAMFVVGKVAGVVSPPAPLHLCGQELPWVPRCEHLGVTLTINGTLEQDCREKRASFIDNSVKIRESFSFAHPLEMITAVEKYCNSFYGSNLWCFDSPEVESIFSAWRTNIKLCWNIPRWSHNYFIDTNLAPHLWPLKSNLLSRFFSFFLSLLNSDSTEVQVVARLAARDLRSNVGSNRSLIRDITGLDP